MLLASCRGGWKMDESSDVAIESISWSVVCECHRIGNTMRNPKRMPRRTQRRLEEAICSADWKRARTTPAAHKHAFIEKLPRLLLPSAVATGNPLQVNNSFWFSSSLFELWRHRTEMEMLHFYDYCCQFHLRLHLHFSGCKYRCVNVCVFLQCYYSLPSTKPSRRWVLGSNKIMC